MGIKRYQTKYFMLWTSQYTSFRITLSSIFTNLLTSIYIYISGNIEGCLDEIEDTKQQAVMMQLV